MNNNFITTEQFKQLAKDNEFPVEILKNIVYNELENTPKLEYYKSIKGLHVVIFNFSKTKTEITISCINDTEVINSKSVALHFKDLSYLFVH